MTDDFHHYARLAQNHNARREIDKALGYFPEDIKTEFDFIMEDKEQQRRIKERRAEGIHNSILLNRYPPYRPPENSKPKEIIIHRQESTCKPLKITLEDGRVILATEYKVLRKR